MDRDSVKFPARRPHYWRVRRKGYRQRLLDGGWYMRGAYAEKVIGGQSVTQKAVATEKDYFLCRFQRKCDWRARIEAAEKCPG